MERHPIGWPLALALGYVLLILPDPVPAHQHEGGLQPGHRPWYGAGPAAATGRALATSAPGLASQGETSSFTLEGKIIKAEPGKFTVSTEENIIFHVRYDDKTDIKHQDGTAGSSKEIKVDAKVKVEGDLTESGEIVAKKIEIEQDSKSPASN